MGERRGAYRILVGTPEGKRPLRMPKRRWIFRKWGGGHGLDRQGAGQGQVAATCKCSNEPPVSIKCEEFLENRLASEEGLFSMA